MNSLPPFIKQYLPRRILSRHNNFLPSLSWCLINPRGHQLHHHHSKYTTSKVNYRRSSSIRLICSNYSSSATPIPSCTSRSHHNTPNRSKFQHIILRPFRGRRPHPLPTPILILWASRSIHSNFTRIRYNLSHH